MTIPEKLTLTKTKNDMKIPRTPKEKLNFKFTLFNIILGVALLVLYFLLRIKFNISAVLLIACMIPCDIGIYVLLSKWIESRKRKNPDFNTMMEELEKDWDEEEALKEKKSANRPPIYRIVILAIICICYPIVEGVELVKKIVDGESFNNQMTASESVTSHIMESNSLAIYLPDIICFFTMLICGVLLTIIAYNVFKGKVFHSTNSLLLYGIGMTIVASALLQNHYWETTEMIPNDTVFMFYIMFGVMTGFCGSLFDIAIKIKEDQDLTI